MEYLYSNAKSVKFKTSSFLHGNHMNITTPLPHFSLGFLYLPRNDSCVDYRKLFSTPVISGLWRSLVVSPSPRSRFKYGILDADHSEHSVAGCPSCLLELSPGC